MLSDYSAAPSSNVMEAVGTLALSELHANTYTGWPNGTPEFVARLEAQLGRRLQCILAG